MSVKPNKRFFGGKGKAIAEEKARKQREADFAVLQEQRSREIQVVLAVASNQWASVSREELGADYVPRVRGIISAAKASGQWHTWLPLNDWQTKGVFCIIQIKALARQYLADAKEDGEHTITLPAKTGNEQQDRMARRLWKELIGTLRDFIKAANQDAGRTLYRWAPYEYMAKGTFTITYGQQLRKPLRKAA